MWPASPGTNPLNADSNGDGRSTAWVPAASRHEHRWHAQRRLHGPAPAAMAAATEETGHVWDYDNDGDKGARQRGHLARPPTTFPPGLHDDLTLDLSGFTTSRRSSSIWRFDHREDRFIYLTDNVV